MREGRWGEMGKEDMVGKDLEGDLCWFMSEILYSHAADLCSSDKPITKKQQTETVTKHTVHNFESIC